MIEFKINDYKERMTIVGILAENGYNVTIRKDEKSFDTSNYKTTSEYYIEVLNQSPIDLKEISSIDLKPEYARLVNENWEELI